MCFLSLVTVPNGTWKSKLFISQLVESWNGTRFSAKRCLGANGALDGGEGGGETREGAGEFGGDSGGAFDDGGEATPMEEMIWAEAVEPRPATRMVEKRMLALVGWGWGILKRYWSCFRDLRRLVQEEQMPFNSTHTASKRKRKDKRQGNS